jgi:hypothetical protein
VSADKIQKGSSHQVVGLDKKLSIGLTFEAEERYGHRICAILNFGLTEIPDEVLARMEESRCKAILQKK